MKQIAKIPVLLILFFTGFNMAYGQVADTFRVQGNLDRFYPVSFNDGGYPNNVATELEIGRSDTHRGGNWSGSVIARFRYHTYNWGNASEFINAEIRQDNINNPVYNKFIAGWRDVTYTNTDKKIIILLRGSTTYSFKSNFPVAPVVYDSVQNPLPYIQTGSTVSFNSKTTIDAYVNQKGMSYSDAAYFNGTANSYFTGSLGIGKNIPNAKLHINAVPGTDLARFTQSDIADTAGCLSIMNGTFTSGHYIPSIVGRAKALGRTLGMMVIGESEDMVPQASDAGFGAIVLDGRSKSSSRLTNNNVLSINSYGQNLLLVKADGSLGIGTTDTKGYKLAVNGSGIFTKLKVKTYGTWPDYVFDPGYKLPSLHEVEEYFTENKHLPDMPSADEIKKEGLDLGEMQKMQMQKIEELTLYIIELRKEIDQLKAAQK